MLSGCFPQLRTILCLGAHADDIEIGCGGTLLKLLDQHPEARVHWVVLTGGGTEREREARASAETFLSRCPERLIEIETFRDSYFPADYECLKDHFHALGRRTRPDVVFTHRREDFHQDHRLVAELSWCMFRRHLIFEYEIPKYEGDLGSPNIYVPLQAEHVERKLQALLTHFPTQRQRPWFSRSTFEAQLRLRGIECHSASGYAEGLYCRKLTL